MRNLFRLGVILAGATAGAAIGVLLAPGKSNKIRHKIVDNFKLRVKGLKNSKEKLQDILSQVSSSKDDGFEAKLTSAIKRATDNTEEVISALERKLSELKTQQNNRSAAHKSDIKKDVVYKAAYDTKIDL